MMHDIDFLQIFNKQNFIFKPLISTLFMYNCTNSDATSFPPLQCNDYSIKIIIILIVIID